MSEIYVFDKNDDDFTTAGLVGALMPTSAVFTDEAGALGTLTIEHPYDKWGKWRALVAGNELAAEVPVRTVPEIRNGAYVHSIEHAYVNDGATLTKEQKKVFKKYNKKDKKVSGKVATVKGGEEVFVVEHYGDNVEYVKVRIGKKTGYMYADALTIDTTEIVPDGAEGMEKVVGSWAMKTQYFFITDVEQKPEGIVVNAMHDTYKLMFDMTTYHTDTEVTLQQALDGILENTVGEHEFNAYTDIADTRVGAHWETLNPIKALLDAEEGAISRWNAQVVRDGMDIYFMHDAGTDRGVRVEYGKNLAGVTCKTDMANIATRIVPIGEDKDGEKLYLDEVYIDSPHIGDYAEPHVYVLEVPDAKYDKNKGVTIDICKARMRQAAQEMLDDGCDVPEVTITVEYASLGDTEEYKQYRELERLYLYDTVPVIHRDIGIETELQVVRLEWNVVLERTEKLELGVLKDTQVQLASWQIPNGINGGKISGNTISQGALANGAITTRHLQAESVNAQAIQSKQITSDHISAFGLDASVIKADQFYARVIEGVIAKLRSITADDIATDELAAEIANIGILTAGDASIRKAIVETLLAAALTVTDAVGENVYIDNLMVKSAQMIEATIGTLTVKASDGKYYRLDFDESGNISPVEVTVTDGEIAAGVTADGTHRIVESSMSVEDLSASNFKAVSALINRLTADQIDAGTLWARDAFIDKLTTAEIDAQGTTITMVASNANSAKETADATAADFSRVVRIDAEKGLRIGDNKTDNEVVIDSDSVNIEMGGTVYSEFGANYVQFGNYQMRKSADGGLVFKLKK